MSLPTSALTTAVNELAKSSDGALLRAQSRPVLEEVASAVDDLVVTRHPLGFMHFELTPIVPLIGSQRIRLHVWTEETLEWSDELGAIHDHTWELNSFVLVGKLADTVLRPFRTNGGSFLATRVIYGDGNYEFEDLDGAFNLDQERIREVSAGHAYRLRPGLLHFTTVSSLPTATLVQARMTEAKTALVFRPRELPPNSRSERPRVSSLDSRATLQSAIEASDKSGAER